MHLSPERVYRKSPRRENRALPPEPRVVKVDIAVNEAVVEDIELFQFFRHNVASGELLSHRAPTGFSLGMQRFRGQDD